MEFRSVNTERAETWRLSFKVGAWRPNGPGARRPSWIGARSTRATLGARRRRPGRTPRTCSHTPSRGAVPPRDKIPLRNNLERRRGAWCDAFGNCGPPRILLRPISATSGTAMKQKTMKQKRTHSRFLPMTCLSDSMTCPSRSAFPCEARAAGDTAYAHQKSIEASLSWFLTSPDSPEEIGTRGIEGQGAWVLCLLCAAKRLQCVQW